jgi:uncharacterized protein (DUF2141 family)
MMRASTILLGMGLAALAVASPAISADDMTMKTANGTVATVDTKANTVTVTVAAEAGAPPSEVRVTVDKQTKIIKDGNAIALADLKPGDEVTVSYRSAGASTIAINIGVRGKRG